MAIARMFAASTILTFDEHGNPSSVVFPFEDYLFKISVSYVAYQEAGTRAGGRVSEAVALRAAWACQADAVEALEALVLTAQMPVRLAFCGYLMTPGTDISSLLTPGTNQVQTFS